MIETNNPTFLLLGGASSEPFESFDGWECKIDVEDETLWIGRDGEWEALALFENHIIPFFLEQVDPIEE